MFFNLLTDVQVLEQTRHPLSKNTISSKCFNKVYGSSLKDQCLHYSSTVLYLHQKLAAP